MNIKKNITAILLLSASFCFSQEFVKKEPVFFNSVFDGEKYINSFYVGNNPAYLKNEVSDQRLSIRTLYFNEEGNFKPFFTPGSETFYQLTFSGKKEISDDQIFQGSFSILKNERKNWDWLATKMYDTGSPYLLGDSTSGTTRYNVMNLNARYSAAIFDNFFAGFAIDYSVDEGLKTVSPRPTSEHRDLFFNLGLGYKFDENTSLGISAKAYDYNEKIVYAEDEGAIYTPTILLKFKGYDFPTRLLKKSEARYSYYNRYFASLDFQHLEDDLKISAVIGLGKENLSVSEGTSDPIPAGSFRNDIYFGKVNAHYNFNKEFGLGINYAFNSEDMWAKHPNFNIVILESSIPSHNISGGLQYNFTPQLTLAFELEACITKSNVNDFYSDISWRIKSTTLIPRFGIKYNWTDNFFISISYSYSNKNNSDSYLSKGVTSTYFENSRIKDVDYNFTKYMANSVYFKTGLNLESIGSFDLFILYYQASPQSSILFDSSNRKNVNVGIEYRVLVY